MKNLKVFKVFALFVVLIFLLSCKVDKTAVESKPEPECWNTQFVIHDYDYIKYQYFFVDTLYLNYYEQGWTDDLSHWIYEASKVIRELEVYKSSTYTNPDARKAITVINPANYLNLQPADYDTVNIVPGNVEKGYFIRLEESIDYEYDAYRGFFLLDTPASKNEIIAASFKTDSDSVGTFLDGWMDTTKLPVLRLIKSENLNPGHQKIWPLLMKNVYSLGDSINNYECFNVQIEHNIRGEHQTIQQVEPKKSYMYLLGLDRVNENGMEIDGGDGIIDNNSLLINLYKGILLFPDPYPFNPLNSSKFQIADTAELYNTTNTADLQCNHKYDIVVTYKANE